MVVIELPDGSTSEYDSPVTAAAVAEDVSPRLAKAAVAAEVDGELRDLTTELADGSHKVRIVTDRDEAALEVLQATSASCLVSYLS